MNRPNPCNLRIDAHRELSQSIRYLLFTIYYLPFRSEFLASVTVGALIAAGSRETHEIAEAFWRLHNAPRESWVTGLNDHIELRSVVWSHIIAWRKDMERRGMASATVRRKLSALSSLFDYLCERNAVTGNPVDGVKRPMANGNEGSTPALGDSQARKLLEAPPADTLKGARDRAILTVWKRVLAPRSTASACIRCGPQQTHVETAKATRPSVRR